MPLSLTRYQALPEEKQQEVQSMELGWMGHSSWMSSSLRKRQKHILHLFYYYFSQWDVIFQSFWWLDVYTSMYMHGESNKGGGDSNKQL